MAFKANTPRSAGKGERAPKASPNPSKAESRPNLKAAFGTPKKQK